MTVHELVLDYHSIATAAYVVLAFFFYKPWREGIYSPLFITASLVTAAWQFSLTLGGDFASPSVISQVLSSLHYAAWISALLATLLSNVEAKNANRSVIPIYVVMLLLTLVGGILTPYQMRNSPEADSFALMAWGNLLLAILGFVVIEQVFRNTLTRQKQAVTFLCIGCFLFFSYDLLIYTNALIFSELDEAISETRSLVNVVAAAVLIFATTRSQQTTTVSLSREMVFYSASLVVAGLFLVAMSASGYWVKLHGGSWGVLLQLILLVTAGLTLCFVIASNKVRAIVRVKVNKHFFLHKYDYRQEWLNLIEVLSQDTEGREAEAIALAAVADIFHSPQAHIWVRDEETLIHKSSFDRYNQATNDKKLPIVDCAAAMAILLESEWVFHPQGKNKPDLENNDALPEWLRAIDDIWIVLPILSQQRLSGMIALSKEQQKNLLTWEDLDVVKTVGRQIGSYLALHRAADHIAQSKQFDTYNKLTAFIMHDLKNLIAQQALVVENAKKHKENPAFVEDAIKTIENSVVRMSNLLKKMQQKEPAAVRSLELNKILMEAANKCREKRPVPSLRLSDNSPRIEGDHDHLVMIFSHVIKNAQEATAAAGFVDVFVEHKNAMAIVNVEDNGQGMDEAFIRERLFKPFDTTKSGQGMGIGVFQTREYIQNLGGEITVDSQPGAGTTFTISIPSVSEQKQHVG